MRLVSDRSLLFGPAAAQGGVQLGRTRPSGPQTNRKAERFIQTLQRQWVYAVAYPTVALLTPYSRLRSATGNAAPQRP